MSGSVATVATGVFKFDPGPHIYTLDGVVLPSVSEILSPLVDFSGIPEKNLNFARDRGTAVHLACQLLDEDDLDWDTLDPQIEPYVRGWQKFTKERDPLWLAIEQSIYHPKLLYAGTPDRVGAFGGKNVIVDIKATALLSPVVAVQLSGYDLMLDKPADELWSVRLLNDGKYELKQHKAVHSTFLSCVNIHNWKRRHPK